MVLMTDQRHATGIMLRTTMQVSTAGSYFRFNTKRTCTCMCVLCAMLESFMAEAAMVMGASLYMTTGMFGYSVL